MLVRTAAALIVLACIAAATPRARASEQLVRTATPLVVPLVAANGTSAARVTMRDTAGGVAVTVAAGETRVDAAGLSGQLSAEQATLYAQATTIERDRQGLVRGLATFAPQSRSVPPGTPGCGGPWSSRALHADGGGRFTGTIAGVTVAQLAAAHASIAVRRTNDALYLVATCESATHTR